MNTWNPTCYLTMRERGAACMEEFLGLLADLLTHQNWGFHLVKYWEMRVLTCEEKTHFPTFLQVKSDQY